MEISRYDDNGERRKERDKFHISKSGNKRLLWAKIWRMISGETESTDVRQDEREYRGEKERLVRRRDKKVSVKHYQMPTTATCDDQGLSHSTKTNNKAGK
jgi:hypothetical protein